MDISRNNQYFQSIKSFPSFPSFKSFDSESSGKSPQVLSPMTPQKTPQNSGQLGHGFNHITFKIMQRTKTKEFSDFGDPIDLQQSIFSANNEEKITYKCYKCYEISKQTAKGTHSKCKSCNGTSFITKKNPMIKIMQDILKNKFNPPPSANPSQTNFEVYMHKRETLGIKDMKDMIRQQSFSYQQQQLIVCKICRKDCQNSNYRYCQKCQDYVICQDCFSKDTYVHQHYLAIKQLKDIKELSKNQSQISEIPNMKKITERFNSQSSQYLSTFQKICTNCQSIINLHYELCLYCQKIGKQYILCPKCSLIKRQIHDIFHRFQKKTLQLIFQDLRPNIVQLQVHSVKNQQNNKYNQLQNIALSTIGKDYIVSDDHSIFDLMQKSNNQDLEDFPYQYNQSLANSLKFKSNQSSFQGQLNMINNMQLNFMVSPIVDRKEKSKEELFDDCNQKQFIFKTQKQEQNQQNVQNEINIINVINAQSAQRVQNAQSAQRVQNLQNAQNQQSIQSIQNAQNVFHGYQCDLCNISPLKRKRYNCTICQDYDLCQQCFINRKLQHFHNKFIQINKQQLLKSRRNQIIQLNMSKRIHTDLLTSYKFKQFPKIKQKK